MIRFLLLSAFAVSNAIVMVSCTYDALDTLPPASYQNSALPYILAPGDEIDVFVWGNPQLSTEVTIRPDGKITTPLAEDIQASGKTPNMLAREMEV